VYLADAVGTQTETLAIRGLSSGVGIARIARHEARAPDCSSAAFSQPRCCPSSAGCGAILHDVDVNTQIEAAVGGAGIVQPFLIRSANHKSVDQLSGVGRQSNSAR
jgi:magnesium transporter